MRKQSIPIIRHAACCLGLGVTATLGTASPIFAADQVKSTTVTAIADPNTTIAFEVTDEIPFYVASDGTLASSNNALKTNHRHIRGDAALRSRRGSISSNPSAHQIKNRSPGRVTVAHGFYRQLWRLYRS